MDKRWCKIRKTLVMSRGIKKNLEVRDAVRGCDGGEGGEGMAKRELGITF